MRALMWFRADLRAHDNTALHAAVQASGPGQVVGVFALCPTQWREHDWAPVKVDLLLRSLSALSDALAARGIPLRVLHLERFSQVARALTRLAAEEGCQALFFNREYEVHERRRDEAVSRRAAAQGLEVRAFHDQVIAPPGEVLTGQGTFYTVFTPFKRAWLRRLEERGLPSPLEAPPRARLRRGVRPDPVPAELEGMSGLRRPDLWPAGEDQALDRLAAFARERLGDYARRRDLPGEPGTSALSPYLALGLISPRQCLAAALAESGGAPDAEVCGAWVNELVWREFYKHLLVGYPRVSMGRSFRPEYERVAWSEDEAAFAAWAEGRTGYPLVDAGMRQLVTTGWMHNRVRMIVATFLSKHLLLDWRRGERFFMQHLVDGDLAANNGGWQWAASTGTDAQPYFRVFNPWTQSARYDPQGVYIREHVPELREVPAAALHDPRRLRAEIAHRRLPYPEPIVDHRSARQRAIDAFAAVRQRS